MLGMSSVKISLKNCKVEYFSIHSFVISQKEGRGKLCFFSYHWNNNLLFDYRLVCEINNINPQCSNNTQLSDTVLLSKEIANKLKKALNTQTALMKVQENTHWNTHEITHQSTH